jgi:chemotaxis protein histidine kinase CheA
MPSNPMPCEEGWDDEILRIYATTLRSAVQILDEHLVELRTAPGEAPLQSALRLVHNLRGSSAQLGFPGPAEVAGRMEVIVDRIRREGRATEPDLSALGAGLAYLNRAIVSLDQGAAVPDPRDTCSLLDGRLR